MSAVAPTSSLIDGATTQPTQGVVPLRHTQLGGVSVVGAARDELAQAGIVGSEAVDLLASVASQQCDGHTAGRLGDELPRGAGVLPTNQFGDVVAVLGRFTVHASTMASLS